MNRSQRQGIFPTTYQSGSDCKSCPTLRNKLLVASARTSSHSAFRPHIPPWGRVWRFPLNVLYAVKQLWGYMGLRGKCYTLPQEGYAGTCVCEGCTRTAQRSVGRECLRASRLRACGCSLCGCCPAVARSARELHSPFVRYQAAWMKETSHRLCRNSAIA